MSVLVPRKISNLTCSLFILSLLGVTLKSLSAYQQSPTHKTRYEFTDTRVAEADTLLKKRQYQEALEAYETVYDQFEKESFYEGMVYVKERIGRAHWMLGKFQLRNSALDSSLVLAKTFLPPDHLLVSKAYFQIGISKYYSHKYQISADYLDSSLWLYSVAQSYDSALYELIVDFKYYTYFFSKGSGDTLVKYLDERSKLQELQNAPVEDRVYLLSDYSGAFNLIGDFQKSAAYALEAVRLCNENLESIGTFYYSDALFSLGRALNSQKQYERALKVTKKLIAFENKQPKKSADYVGYLNLRGVVLNNLGRYAEATEDFKAIVTQLEKSNESNTPFYRTSIMNLGVNYQLMGRDSLAEYFLYKSLMEGKNKSGMTSSGLSQNFKYLGQHFSSLKQHEKGVLYYDSAIRVKIKPSVYDLLEFPINQKLEITFDLLDLLKNKQENLVQLFKEKYQDSLEILVSSIEHVETTHNYLMHSRYELMDSEGKLFLSENFKELYENGLEALFLFSQSEGLTGEVFERVYNFLGYSKSLLFLEQSSEIRGVLNPSLPVKLRNTYFETKTTLDSLEAHFYTFIDEVTTSDSLKLINKNLMLVNDEMKRLQDSILHITNNNGAVELFASKNFSATTEYLNQNKNTALIEFFMGKYHIYVMCVSHDSKYFNRVLYNDALRTEIISTIRSVSKRPTLGSSYAQTLQKYQTSASFVYELLLKGALKSIPGDINRLNIIPDELLSYLPFEALVSSSRKGADSYQNLNYLINKFSVSYALSTAKVIDSQVRKRASKKLLGIGYSGTNPTEARPGLVALPGTEHEIRFLQDNLQGDYLFGEEGNKRQFLEKARSYDVLHLAIHGEADSSNRYQSSLIFNGSSDKVLLTSDLYLAGLNARLAILSACESGIGEINEGEGTFSIARGFALVGVPSVVMSLWQVSDDLSIKLISEFYKGLSEDEFISEALRNAKLHYLEESDNLTSHPFYWASFVHLGVDQEIEIRPKARWGQIWWWLIIVLILSACWWVADKLRRRVDGSSHSISH